VREADLDRHLSNEGEAKSVGLNGSISAKRDAKRDELEEEQRALAMLKNAAPPEFGSKDDFQLAQAINHFKGLPVKQAKADPLDDAPSPARLQDTEQKPPEVKGPKK
jgi:carboxyl-terminal processing protease